TIAENAPANWYEVLGNFEQEIVKGLQDKRLVIRSGDRLNLYWDIFRIYVLTKDIPSIPLTYLPSSPSLRTSLTVARLIDMHPNMNLGEIGKQARLSEKSAGNVVRDLVMFGVASTNQFQVNLDSGMQSSELDNVLRRLRQALRRHALTISLSKKEPNTVFSESDIIECLKEVNPTAQHKERTWKIYTERLTQLLLVTGYLVEAPDGFLFQDCGDVSIPTLLRQFRGKGQRGLMFVGESPPLKTVEGYEWLRLNQPKTGSEIKLSGYRNAIQSLNHLGLTHLSEGKYCIVQPSDLSISAKEIVWDAARNNEVVKKVMEFIQEHPVCDGQSIGKYINQ
ncbi:MAG: hypothetical protein MI923_27050, partial [Phycisphaerales bacterium]|nr:hypothetical protein [Phycisphaerales bacterium]